MVYNRSVFKQNYRIGILVVFLLIISSKVDSQSNYINSANSALKQFDLERAEELLVKAEEHCGESEKIRQNATVLLGLSGDYEQALELVNTSIKKDAKNPEHYYNRALLYLHKEEFLTAIDDFQKASSLGGKRRTSSEKYANGLKRQSEEKQIEAFIKLAEQAAGDQQFDLAHQYYDRALLIKPKDTHLLFAKSNLGLMQGNPFLTLESLEKINHAQTTSHQQRELTLLKAYSLARINKMPDAIRLLENELRKEPSEDMRARELLAYYYIRLSKYQKTLEVLRGRHVSQANTYVVWGNAAVRLKKYSFALACFDRAKSMEHENLNAELGTAISYSFLNRNDRALHLIDSLANVHMDNHTVWNVKGIIYKDVGLNHKNSGRDYRANPYFETSAAAFQKAKELNPNMTKVYDSNRALSLFLQNQKEKARLIWTGNNEVSSQNNLAIYYASKKQFNQSYQLFTSLNDDFWSKHKKKHNVLDYNKDLARSRTSLNNNYKFLTNFKLNEARPNLEVKNPFLLQNNNVVDKAASFDYMLAYSDKECAEKTKRKKAKKIKRFKLFKRKKKKNNGDCPTF